MVPVRTLEYTWNLERRLLPATTRMTLAGVPVNYDAWVMAAEKCKRQLESLTEYMHNPEVLPQKTGSPIPWNPCSPKSEKRMLVRMGYAVYDTNAKTLRTIAKYEPPVQLVLDYRAASSTGDERKMESLYMLLQEHGPKHDVEQVEPWNFRSHVQVKQLALELGYDISESSNELALLKLKDEHEFFSLMLRYRKLAKLVDSYGIDWFKDSYYNGRIYCSWRQIGTVTGRWACSKPNMQQLPNDGPYRSCIEAPEGRTLVIADYSQIELRIAAKLAKDQGMLEAFRRGDDIHNLTAQIITGKKAKEITKSERGKAKSINFGLLYGMWWRSLPDYALKNYGVKLSEEEAEAFYNRYFQARRGLKEWQRRERERFLRAGEKIDGYTLTGRVRRDVTKLTDLLNMPVQGTGADGLKYALVLLHEDRERFPTAVPILVAHDEIVYEVDEEDAEYAKAWVESTMVAAMDQVVNRTVGGPHVPIEVEAKISRNWVKD